MLTTPPGDCCFLSPLPISSFIPSSLPPHTFDIEFCNVKFCIESIWPKTFQSNQRKTSQFSATWSSSHLLPSFPPLIHLLLYLDSMFDSPHLPLPAKLGSSCGTSSGLRAYASARACACVMRVTCWSNSSGDMLIRLGFMTKFWYTITCYERKERKMNKWSITKMKEGEEEGVGRGERSQYLFDWNIVQVAVEQNDIVESISILFHNLPWGES